MQTRAHRVGLPSAHRKITKMKVTLCRRFRRRLLPLLPFPVVLPLPLYILSILLLRDQYHVRLTKLNLDRGLAIVLNSRRMKGNCSRSFAGFMKTPGSQLLYEWLVDGYAISCWPHRSFVRIIKLSHSNKMLLPRKVEGPQDMIPSHERLHQNASPPSSRGRPLW